MRLAAIDLGTNSMRLLIARLESGRVEWIDRRTTVTGLGRGVDETGRLADDRIEATIDVLAGYGAAIDMAGVDRRRAVATSATRDAANREEFLDAAGDALGIRPEMISGEEEAALAFVGATSGLDALGGTVVIDTGGGSTELVMGQRHPSFRASVDMGSVRLTERDFANRPASVEDLERAQSIAAIAFRGAQIPQRAELAIGVAGTFTSLAAIDQDLPAYDPGRVHGHTLTRARMNELILYLAGLTVEETSEIPSLDPARAPVILAGAIVAREAMAVVGFDSVIVSEHDMLDGIVLGLGEA